MTSEFVPLLKADDLADKSLHCTVVGGVPVALCRVGGKVFAVANECSHAKSPFDDGRLRGFHIICPLHGAMFDVRSGEPLGLPARKPIDAYATRVNSQGMIEVDVTTSLNINR